METNKIKTGDEYRDLELVCVRCHSKERINMWPHITPEGLLVGFIFACSNCKDWIDNCKLTFEFRDKTQKEGG